MFRFRSNGMVIRYLLSWTFDPSPRSADVPSRPGSSRTEQPERIHQGW
jgi:hypothetical protein